MTWWKNAKMKTTQILSNEHIHILSVLDVLEAVCTKLKHGTDFPKDDCLAIADFFQGYADKFHHGKEEDLLFPIMIERGIPVEGGPIGVMLHEHDIGRSKVRAIKDFTLNYTSDTTNFSQFIDDARSFIELLRAHIHKEDNILYNIANQVLTNSDQDKLFEQYKTVDNSRESEFLKNVETLKMKYLS